MLPEFLNTALAFPSIAIKINLMLSLIIKPGAWDKRNALPGCLIGGLDLNQKLKEKIMESLSSVIPVTAIVLILGITLTPMPLDSLMLFLTGAAFLIVGMGFFTLGAELAMIPIGEKTGLHTFVVGKYQGQAKLFKKKELREILEMAADLEESVKTGRLTDALATELFIVKYSAA